MTDTSIPHTNTDGSATQFIWAMQRLAQMQGGSLDLLQLNSASLALSSQAHPFQALRKASVQLGLPSPKQLKFPDRLLLPLLCHVGSVGWAVVTDRTPQGQWVVTTPQGSQSMTDAQLADKTVWLRIAEPVQLGFGLSFLGAKAKDESFIALVYQGLKQHKVALTEACLASAFIGLLSLGTSLFSMQVYDRVIPVRSDYTLIILGVGVLIAILIELGMKFARSHVMDHIIVGLDQRLSREIFQRLLQLRVDQVPASVGSLSAQLRGYEQVRGFYTASTLFTLIDLPLAVVFLAIIMAIASPWLALVPLVFAVLALALGVSIRRQIMWQAREGAAMSNMKTGLLVEAVEGIETIKAGSGGWKFLSRWINVNQMTIHNDLKMRRATESVGYVSATVQQISYALLVALGAVLVMHGDMTMGALIASSILSGRILAPVMAIPGLLVQHAHAQAALQGIERIYQLKTDHHGTPSPLAPTQIEGHFKLEDVTFAYGDNPPALSIGQWEVKPAERIAILGPIGAGKSTLLRILSGMYTPQAGRVLLDQLDLSHINRQVVCQHIGYLQQDHRLFQGSLRENLLIGMPDPGDEAILHAMKQTGMDRFVASHPRGLARQIAEGGKGLSGGQKQLVAFTRLVLCDPAVWLLDEPTASMDDDQERRCLSVLAQRAQQGKTLVIVTHKPSLLPLVNRMVVMSGNGIVLDGARDQVLNELQARHAKATGQVPQTVTEVAAL
jgi:ATP-binding cassette subfamily C protein LapB